MGHRNMENEIMLLNRKDIKCDILYMYNNIFAKIGKTYLIYNHRTETFHLDPVLCLLSSIMVVGFITTY
jgi:hypothetical protein